VSDALELCVDRSERHGVRDEQGDASCLPSLLGRLCKLPLSNQSNPSFAERRIPLTIATALGYKTLHT